MTQAATKYLTQKAGPNWADYNKEVVKDWSRKPRFVPIVIVSRDTIDLVIRVMGPHRMLWFWVDQGTATGREKNPTGPYKIRPVNAPALKFRSDYRPRTLPVANYRVGPGVALGPWQTRQEVTHPGIEARKFTTTQADEVRFFLADDMIRYINREINR